jgi:hypothetical protein
MDLPARRVRNGPSTTTSGSCSSPAPPWQAITCQHKPDPSNINPSWPKTHLFPGCGQLVIRDIFHQILDSAIEKSAQPIQIIGFGAESAPIDHSGQGDTVNADALGDFANHNPPPFREFLPSHQLFDFETQHIRYSGFQLDTNVTKSRGYALALFTTDGISFRT